LLEATSDVAIVGNVFAGLADSAVHATGECRRVTLVGNVVSDIGRRDSGRSPRSALTLSRKRSKPSMR